MEQRPPQDDRPSPSRFEDLSDIHVPTPVRGRPSRPAIVTTAAVVLFVSALMNGIVAGAGLVEGSALMLSGGLAVAQALGALLVVLLVPIGRPFGVVLGAIGVVIGLVIAARGSAASGLVTIGLNGFVIYALAASGPSFRRG